MTQPDYVPLIAADRVRPSDRLSAPGRWAPERPGDLADMRPPEGRRFGSSGPDQGYGLKLARRVADRLDFVDHDEHHDALAGCFACGTKRSALLGRAPVIYDFQWAFTLWGYMGSAHTDLARWRRGLFKGAGHDYVTQRAIVDHVADGTFGLSPEAVAAAAGGTAWEELFIRR